MMKLKINKDSKVFIFAPSKRHTGGPELLHQLCNELSNNKINSYMYYYPKIHLNPVHDNYKKYNVKYKRFVRDSEENVIILPEVYAYLANHFKRAQVIVWWLSVDNYFSSRNSVLQMNTVTRSLKFKKLNLKLDESLVFSDNILHLVQSRYAFDFLNSKNISNIMFLSDYLSPEFLQNNGNPNKENYVCYNPKKGIEFTNQIVEYCKDINFKPLIGYTYQEMIEVLGKSKLYIDFGEHPGKDRIPREAAHLGCNVIVGLRGSAVNEQDIPIPNEYKFETKSLDLKLIKEKILSCINYYEENAKNFDQYRDIIKNEQEIFKKEVKNIFCRD